MRHPGQVKGIAALVGYVPDAGDADIHALARLPVFMASGRDDPRVPLARVAVDAERLRQTGARLDYRVYETEHRLNLQGMRDLKRWWDERVTE